MEGLSPSRRSGWPPPPPPRLHSPNAASLQQAVGAAPLPLPRSPSSPSSSNLPFFPQMGDMTLLELSKYDGRDPFRPLLLAVRGQVFDVTLGRAFYGPGAPVQVRRSPFGTSEI